MFEDDCFCGEGTLYYPTGQKMLEGLFALDQLVRGKVFSPEGVLIKEGMFQQQKLHGKGARYDSTGAITCKGIFYENILIGIEGQINENPFLQHYGKWQGTILDVQSERFGVKMHFLDGLQHGETILSDENRQLKATFSFEQGHLKYHKRYRNHCLSIEGEVKDYDLNGHGKIYNSRGALCYEGLLQNGKRHGMGTVILNNGDHLTAAYSNDIQQGTGEVRTPEGRLIYKGDLFDEQIHGEGTYYYEDGSYFVGHMAFGFPQKGTHYDAAGRVISHENRPLLDRAITAHVHRHHVVK